MHWPKSEASRKRPVQSGRRKLWKTLVWVQTLSWYCFRLIAKNGAMILNNIKLCYSILSFKCLGNITHACGFYTDENRPERINHRDMWPHDTAESDPRVGIASFNFVIESAVCTINHINHLFKKSFTSLYLALKPSRIVFSVLFISPPASLLVSSLLPPTPLINLS